METRKSTRTRRQLQKAAEAANTPPPTQDNDSAGGYTSASTAELFDGFVSPVPNPRKRKKAPSSNVKPPTIKKSRIQQAEQNAAALPPVPTYKPLVPRFEEHEAANTLPRETGAALTTPKGVFYQFMSDDVLDKITVNTNVYTTLHGGQETSERAGEGRSWTPMSCDALCVWISILIIMGVTKEPPVDDYWRPKDGINAYHPFTEHMSLKRFWQIKRYLHVTYPEYPDGERKQIHKTYGTARWTGILYTYENALKRTDC